VDGEIFVSGKKKLRIQKYPDTWGRGLKHARIFVRGHYLFQNQYYHYKSAYSKIINKVKPFAAVAGWLRLFFYSFKFQILAFLKQYLVATLKLKIHIFANQAEVVSANSLSNRYLANSFFS